MVIMPAQKILNCWNGAELFPIGSGCAQCLPYQTGTVWFSSCCLPKAMAFCQQAKKKKKIKEKQKTKLKGLNIVFVHNAKQWSTMSKIVKITEKKVNVK